MSTRMLYWLLYAEIQCIPCSMVDTSAALDAYNLSCPGREFRRLLARSILAMFFIGLVVYAPAAWLIKQLKADKKE